MHAWIDGWTRGWREHDPEAVGALYAADATFFSHPFRAPRKGRSGAADYVREAFAEEEWAEFWFAEPMVAGEQAAVQYWAVLGTTDGKTSTLAGVSLLRFGADGLVAEHRDYWAMEEGDGPPPEGWGPVASHGRRDG